MILMIDEFGNTWAQPHLYKGDRFSIAEGIVDAFQWVGEFQQWIEGEWRSVGNNRKGEDDV